MTEPPQDGIRTFDLDRLRTLELCVISDAEIETDFIKNQMIQQCAVELTHKLFEHNKIKIEKTVDGKFSHSVRIEVIVPKEPS